MFDEITESVSRFHFPMCGRENLNPRRQLQHRGRKRINNRKRISEWSVKEIQCTSTPKKSNLNERVRVWERERGRGRRGVVFQIPASQSLRICYLAASNRRSLSKFLQWNEFEMRWREVVLVNFVWFGDLKFERWIKIKMGLGFYF